MHCGRAACGLVVSWAALFGAGCPSYSIDTTHCLGLCCTELTALAARPHALGLLSFGTHLQIGKPHTCKATACVLLAAIQPLCITLMACILLLVTPARRPAAQMLFSAPLCRAGHVGPCTTNELTAESCTTTCFISMPGFIAHNSSFVGRAGRCVPNFMLCSLAAWQHRGCCVTHSLPTVAAMLHEQPHV